MRNLNDFFIQHNIDITPYYKSRPNFAIQILYLVLPIRLWFFLNKHKKLYIFKELFEIELDLYKLSFYDICTLLFDKYLYNLLDTFSIRNMNYIYFIKYMNNTTKHSYNAMIIYNTIDILCVLKWGEEFLTISINTLNIYHNKNTYELFIFIKKNIGKQFYMGNVYLYQNIKFNKFLHNKDAPKKQQLPLHICTDS